jgi:hypothetical protein
MRMSGADDQGHHAVVRWLDWMIAPSLRSDAERVTQARVVVGTAAALAGSSVAMALLTPVFGVPVSAAAVFFGCGVLYALAVMLVRFRASLRAATIIVAATLAGVMTLMALQKDGLHMVFSVWNAAIPLFVT